MNVVTPNIYYTTNKTLDVYNPKSDMLSDINWPPNLDLHPLVFGTP